MAESSIKRQKKGIITQQHIHSVLQRYSVTTVLTLLKEVAQVGDMKIDWNELVKKTATGISNAREYQMLWRHMAYRDILEEKLDQGAVPMDDDSDLEFELEAHPPVSSDASTEAAACVKVMIASGSLVDANISSVVEAPLSINILSGWSSSSSGGNPQLQETNLIYPVLVPKQPLLSTTAASSVEILDANEPATGGNLPPRRKRKQWTKKEDDELLAAVQRNGEGNWANILKGDFKSDRTASQLSQRWAIIKKRKENSSVRSGPADLHALRRAFNLALDMPIGDNSRSTFMNGRGGTNPSTSTQPGVHNNRQDSEFMTSSKSRFTKTSTLSPDAMVKAAAVAAGARIATPSDAATLLKAAQSKNAVHIIPSGTNSIKSSGPTNLNSLPPNVHYIRTGLVNRPTSTQNNVIINNVSKPGGTHQAQSQITRPSLPTALINQPHTLNEINLIKEKLCEEVVVQKTVTSVSCNEVKGNIQDQAIYNEANKPAKVDQNGSEKVEENKMIEISTDEEREIKTTVEEKGSEKREENRMVELPVVEESDNKSMAMRSGSEMEKENKMVEVPVEEEREKK